MLNWLLISLGVRARPQPTPLEIAAASLIATQVALLEAKSEAERWNASVEMYRGRARRLAEDLHEFSAQKLD